MASKSKLRKHNADIEFGTEIPVWVKKKCMVLKCCGKPCLYNILGIRLPLMWSYWYKVTKRLSLNNTPDLKYKKEQAL